MHKNRRMRRFLCMDTLLDGLSSPDLLVELHCGGGRRYVQLAAQGFHAGLVLAQRQVVLALAAVTAHQAAVGILTTAIMLQHALAQGGGWAVLSLIVVDQAQAFERLHPWGDGCGGMRHFEGEDS